MRRFRLLFLIFAVALLAPVALLVGRALRSVALERGMRHQAVAERIFDEMERGLSRLLEREEQRPFDQYGTNAEPPMFPFIVGHFQVDPDGNIRAVAAPRAEARASGPPSERWQAVTAEIERIVGAHRRVGRANANVPQVAASQVPGTTIELGAGARPATAGAAPAGRDELAAKSEVSAFDALRALNKGVQERVEHQKQVAQYASRDAGTAAAHDGAARRADARVASAPSAAAPDAAQKETLDAARSEIELTPMTGRVVDSRHLLLSRTVVSEAKAYRQGLLIDVEQLGVWLRAQGVGSDAGSAEGLAGYASVWVTTPFATAPVPATDSPFVYQHRFAEPFADLTARLALRQLPGVGSVTYVYALCALLLATGVLGLAALYRMVSVVVSFAERRGNFVAAVSHELKTPLTAIRMYGEMLRDGMVASDAKRQEYYRHITAESERLTRLINNVLEFSRLEKGTRAVVLIVGSVAPVVHDVAELLRPHVNQQGFELHLEVAADLPPVRFERDALTQVLCNLVDNAVKYAREAAPKQIVLRGWHDDAGVHLSVRDHGPGVPPRHLGKIFEPFYRGETELTRRSKGTGLGLALVHGLVERMGARVSGRNVPAGGFEVEIAFRPVSA